MNIDKIKSKVEKIKLEEDENSKHIIKLYKNYLDLNSDKNMNLDISNITNVNNVETFQVKDGFVHIIDLKEIKKIRSFYEVTNFRYENILQKFDNNAIATVFKKYSYPYVMCDLEKCINKLKIIYKDNKDKNIQVLYKNYDGSNKHKDIINILSKAVALLNIENKEQRNSMIYDFLCEYLENDIKLLNYCDFKDSVCIAKRDIVNNKTNYPQYEKDGCCHSFVSPQRCEYLNKKNTCDITCISCRAFVCKYLKERGQGYNFFDSVIFRCFCGPLKNRVYVWNFFKPKEQIMKKYNKKIF